MEESWLITDDRAARCMTSEVASLRSGGPLRSGAAGAREVRGTPPPSSGEGLPADENRRNRVGRHRLIRREQHEIERMRLGDEQAIERVAVQWW